MKRAHEELFGTMFALTFPVVVGFVVAVSIYVDGIGAKSLFLLATWLFFVSACAVACGNVGANEVIPANVLPLVFVGGAVIFQVALILGSFVLEKTGSLSWPMKS